MDDLFTARAAILQLASAGCGVVAHRMLAGVHDLYTARAAIRQPASAGCRVVMNTLRK
jgi:pantothenate kinase-related protein Tda10